MKSIGYNKHRNIKTTVDGIKFDSKAEAQRYLELKLLQREGVIKNLQLQPAFSLQDKFKHKGVKYRAIVYRSDFLYEELKGGRWVEICEDVKGQELPGFLIKKKMFLAKYGEKIVLRISKLNRKRFEIKDY